MHQEVQYSCCRQRGCSAGDARELVTASLDKSLALWRLQVSSLKADGH